MMASNSSGDTFDFLEICYRRMVKTKCMMLPHKACPLAALADVAVSGSPVSFTCFNDLPSEIRLKIWSHILWTPQIIRVKIQLFRGYHYLVPLGEHTPLLKVCSESRIAAQYTHKPYYVSDIPPTLFPNLAIDVLWLSELSIGPIRRPTIHDLLPSFAHKRNDLTAMAQDTVLINRSQEMTSIAIPADLWGESMGNLSPTDILKSLLLFPSLVKVNLVASESLSLRHDALIRQVALPKHVPDSLSINQFGITFFSQWTPLKLSWLRLVKLSEVWMEAVIGCNTVRRADAEQSGVYTDDQIYLQFPDLESFRRRVRIEFCTYSSEP
ncbi:hypothetical protein BJ878DRAFT_260573 [Calycina marina]|uniref:2EXR domain-containing protein n=1 Tax=Calycina marina TaxID=1763456 RepID=A0A9P7Z7I3_9HELO|nr:hypothetical protein BJ878DRAFT_260573 [Calycina marina]